MDFIHPPSNITCRYLLNHISLLATLIGINEIRLAKPIEWLPNWRALVIWLYGISIRLTNNGVCGNNSFPYFHHGIKKKQYRNPLAVSHNHSVFMCEINGAVGNGKMIVVNRTSIQSRRTNHCLSFDVCAIFFLFVWHAKRIYCGHRVWLGL